MMICSFAPSANARGPNAINVPALVISTRLTNTRQISGPPDCVNTLVHPPPPVSKLIVSETVSVLASAFSTHKFRKPGTHCIGIPSGLASGRASIPRGASTFGLASGPKSRSSGFVKLHADTTNTDTKSDRMAGPYSEQSWRELQSSSRHRVAVRQQRSRCTSHLFVAAATHML